MTQRKPTKRPKQNKCFPVFCLSLRHLCASASLWWGFKLNAIALR